MRLQWLLLAEGLGQDSRGAWTAISINQNIIFADKLPVQTKRAIVAHMVDDGDLNKPYTGTLQVRFSVVSPDGQTVHANVVQVEVGAKKFANLPGSGDIPAEFGLNIQKYGTYVVSVELEKSDGTVDKMQESIYVVKGSGGSPKGVAETERSGPI